MATNDVLRVDIQPAPRVAKEVRLYGNQVRIGSVYIDAKTAQTNGNAHGWSQASFNVLRVMQPHPGNLTKTRFTTGTNDVALANILLAANVDREALRYGHHTP